MLALIGKISLRTRLFLLTVFALTALLIAVLSAFRTAQMSATFAERQTEISVNAAGRELAREAPEIGKLPNQFDKEGRLLPHLRDIYSRYTDEPSRTTAIALHRFENVSGGFCTNRGEPVGFISANQTAIDERQLASNICRNTVTDPDFISKKINVENVYFYTVTMPVFSETGLKEKSSNEIISAIAFKSLPKSDGYSDRFNLLTQGFLVVSVIVVALFSFLTLREWRRGMLKIESGLHEISQDLSARIDEQGIIELEKISKEINALAENLETNLARQKQLETDLTRHEKLAALGRVASGIAHEVRNPLASMKLKIQLAERNKFDTTKLEKTFNILEEEINRLDTLVKKLLDISRPTTLNMSRISLVNIIKQRLSLIEEQTRLQNISVETAFPSFEASVSADPEKLAQIFDNVFLNAIQSMPGGGNLSVAVKECSASFQVKIADDGSGIDKNARERLFEPFFTTRDNGTGLGLAISREIIEAHGGKIYLTDADRTEFVVEIPKPKD